jgi:hypothetical protein
VLVICLKQSNNDLHGILKKSFLCSAATFLTVVQKSLSALLSFRFQHSKTIL